MRKSSIKSEPKARNIRVRVVNGIVLVVFISIATVFLAASFWADPVKSKNDPIFPQVNKSAQTEESDDPAVWGKRFPLHYELFKKTVDQSRTRFGGSEAVQVTPKDSDPRSVVSQSRLEEDPRLVTMWNGYAFSVDFREERGYAYMLDDQTFTGRQAVVKQPGSCINCHASTYLTYKRLGDGDIFKGFDALNKMPFTDARKEVSHPVSCIDCHDSKTLKLRITKPAFMVGIAAYKASQGVKDYDVNRDATRNEMRSFVCGQCHVEYYFKGEGKTLTFPWSNGLKVDNILAYYDEAKHKDWVHKETGAEVLKAQHPEFEMFNQGSHGRAGVSCADCHMPKTAGLAKITDHWIRSPLLNIAQSCQACHKADSDELKSRAETIQNRTYSLRNLAMDALMDLIAQIKAAKAAGRSDADLSAARDYQRKAQFYLDFIEAENSMGFHAPQESTRVLGESINFSRFGLMSLGGFKPVHPFQGKTE
ncbi:MAG: ammonia-forming cytochrome c nitrite reductase subunit c552 [Chloracidobacterium sp.]|nr:ammonia-forming cytochrome c nitrite reductase subunit c552 [Chloracidobacterium sp.]